MAWTTIVLVSTGELATASVQNTQVLGNLNELRTGGIAIASQAALDFIFGNTATQLGRLAKGSALQSIRLNSGATAYEFFTPGAGSPTEETTTATGTQNNYDLDAAYTYLRCNNASALTLTGFTVTGAAPTGGDRVIVHNVGSSTVKVTDEDSGSTAANRCATPSAAGQIIGADGSMGFVYDTTTDRWRLEWVEPGAPIDVAHGGLTFGSGWTVDAGDLALFKFQQRGRLVIYWIRIISTTVASSPTSLTITESSLLPGGFTGSFSDAYAFARVVDNGTAATGILYTGTTTILRFERIDGATWANSTNNTHVMGMIFVAID